MEINKTIFNSLCCFQITDAKMAVTFDLEDLQLRPEKDVLLTEMIHAVRFFHIFFLTVRLNKILLG